MSAGAPAACPAGRAGRASPSAGRGIPQPARGQFLNLLRRQIDSVALGDPGLDVLDDLIDVGWSAPALFLV
jgi:hypothetical protein